MEIKPKLPHWDAGRPSVVFTFPVSVLSRSHLEPFRTRQEDVRNFGSYQSGLAAVMSGGDALWTSRDGSGPFMAQQKKRLGLVMTIFPRLALLRAGETTS